MRFFGKSFVFVFSIVHRLVSIIAGAHICMLRNLCSRHPDADRPRAVKRA